MSPRSLVSALDLLTLARGAQRDRRRQKPRGRGTKAAATLGGERLEPRLALAIDFASGLPADMTASAYLFIGDHSVSNSEIWRMNVAATPLSAPDFGVVLREQGTFARGVSYPITVDWLDSNRAAGPDYDYRAWIDRSANPTWTSGSPTPSSPDFFVTDPGQLLQRRWFGSEVNATLGKTAELHFPGVDLDVDSDNSGSVDGSPAEDALELVSTTGVNVPVSTASMAGLTPLVVGISDNLRHAATTGQVSFTFSSTAPTAFRLWRDAARTLPLPWGTAVTAAQLGLAFGGRLNLQLEVVTQTSSFAAITTTALVTGGIWQGTLQDTVRARGVPGVDLTVTPRAVAEDGFQGLTYTFSRAVATSSPLTIHYVLGGSATEARDFTGLPAGSGTRSMTIPAGATTASLTVFPTPDSDIEPDETVVLTLLPGTGYAVGSKSVAMGTIQNDDYLLDLILDGLPEETVPGPNELSPGAFLPTGGSRKRLDLVVQSPGNAGTITLTIPSGADRITLWDAETGGQQVFPGQWQVGQHPRTLWVKDTGIKGDIQVVAMFQNRGQTKEDAVNAIAIARPDIEFDATQITAEVGSWMNGSKNRLEDNGVDVFNLFASSAIVVDQAMGTFRSIHVKAQAIDDPAISRENREEFFFRGKQTLSGWSIFRGADDNPGKVWNWLRDYHPEMGVSTPADFRNLPDDQETYWETEFEKWSDPRITAQRMTGTLDVTYVYAGKLDSATQWIRGRSDFDLAPGAPTPLGHEYPYPRPLNVDYSKWVQNFTHRADKPAEWDLTSTLTLHLEFTIDLEKGVSTVVGTWAIDDIDGQSNGCINVDVSIAAP